ncbi:MAG: Sulfur carrier protein adenylyltransferase ThiF [Gammaproteobacteria bacterium]|jgi:adenylyltransferase/sulfurtransferase|nr:Sulfur carrier protein adenylyltransferase ThiF [Gammaproteobacteria bacterium]
MTPEETQRYSRHFSLPHLGVAGQKRLKRSKILCIGAGGLGSPALHYLCAAGVGTLGIIDHDRVELSNLQRQILYNVKDIGQLKTLAAKSRLLKQNPNIDIIAHPEKLTEKNALSIIQDYDIVLDGTDNFNARYLINDACCVLGKPNIYAGVFQFSGECSVFMPNNGPCYRCLYDTPPSISPNCSEAGVLGVVPGIMGTIQATEALKLALGQCSSLVGKVLRFNALNLTFETFTLSANPDCPLCSNGQSFYDLSHHHSQELCTMTSLNNDASTSTIEYITPQALKTLMEQNSDFILLDVREPEEYEECNLAGLLIPLRELNLRHHELDKEKSIIVHCRMDGRSLQAAEFLCQIGFPTVKYLKGGIVAWAQEIGDMPNISIPL